MPTSCAAFSPRAPPARFVRLYVQRLAAAAGVERPARDGEVEPWCDAGVCDKVRRRLCSDGWLSPCCFRIATACEHAGPAVLVLPLAACFRCASLHFFSVLPGISFRGSLLRAVLLSVSCIYFLALFFSLPLLGDISIFLLCFLVSLPLSLYILNTFLNLPSYSSMKVGSLVPRLCIHKKYFFHFQLACSLTIRVARPGLWVAWVGGWVSCHPRAQRHIQHPTVPFVPRCSTQ